MSLNNEFYFIVMCGVGIKYIILILYCVDWNKDLFISKCFQLKTFDGLS